MRCMLLACTVAAASTFAAAAEPARRNVVLLIADDLGLDLGCYGNSAIKSPNIDALARSGARFTHGFACVASCSPSRSTLYTGQYTHSNGQYGLAHATHHFHTRAAAPSLPKLLKPAGYRTGIIAKNHVIPREVYPWDVEIPGNGRNVVQMAQQSRKFIDECGDKPFLLVLGYTDPHRAAKGFGNAVKDVPDVTYDPKDVLVPYHLPDRPEVRADLADYYRSISRLDYGVGEMMKVLRETGRDADTLVILLSDNGRPFPGGKTTLYDAGVHLPLIVKAPGSKPGVTCSAMASWIDIAPTILAWTGVKQPPAMIGRSLLPVLDTEKTDGWDEVFGSHQFHEITMYYPVRMLRTRTHKYLLNLASNLEYPFASDIYGSASWQCVLKNKLNLGERTATQFLHRPQEELYDLSKDPNELKNVADDPQYRNVLSDLRQRVRAWQEKTADPWLIKYQHE